MSKHGTEWVWLDNGIRNGEHWPGFRRTDGGFYRVCVGGSFYGPVLGNGLTAAMVATGLLRAPSARMIDLRGEA